MKDNQNNDLPVDSYSTAANTDTGSSASLSGTPRKKRSFRKASVIAIVFLLAASLIIAYITKKAAPASDDSYTNKVFAMDTYMTLTAYGEKAEAAVTEASDCIYRLDSLLSVTDSNSEISKINARTSDKMSDDTFAILSAAREYSTLTHGALDITVYPLVKAWGFTTGSNRVPGDQELATLLTHVGNDKFSLDNSSRTISFTDSQTEIDTGAIAKGYASQRVHDIFANDGITSAIVSLGGNVCAYGSRPDGSDWEIAIENPFDTKSTIATIKTSDKFLVTSGSYQRYFVQDGVTYHHIIDPSTGKPADKGLVSVSIITGNGTTADALSTALFVMGKDGAIDFWRSCTTIDFDCVLIDSDKNIYVTDGLRDSFSSNSENVSFVSR